MMSGPQQASGFGAPRMPTPHAAYESMSTTPGFTYPLPAGRTPSNLAHNYPLPTSSGKRSSASSSSTSSSRSGSQSHRSCQSVGSIPMQNFVVLPSVSLVGRAVMSPGASPPDPTTYMNTLCWILRRLVTSHALPRGCACHFGKAAGTIGYEFGRTRQR